MLNDPHSITDADIDSIVSLTETYPYFVPARYMEAASQHKHQPFNADMMNTMQLYMGNWIVFHQYMQTAHGGEYVEQITTNYDYEEPAEVDAAEEDYADETIGQPEASMWSQDEDDEEEIVAADEEETVVAMEAMDVEEDFEEEIEADDHYIEDENYDDSYLDEEDEEEEVIHENIVAADEEEEYDEEETEETEVKAENDENLILPIYTEDYFLHQGIQVSNNIPTVDKQEEAAPGLLMRMMSYSEWLNHFKTHGEKAREEEQDQKALKTMWQKEKLAAAIEEENEEIPENVFEMAVNSITKEEGMASEPLAEIYVKQGKYDAAIDMYKKLSLRNPQKSAYFARKVEEILKEK
jgi:hypothetical protein